MDHFRASWRAVLLGLVFGAAIGSGTGLAFASSASSQWGYYGPFAGYDYKNQAQIINSTADSAYTTAARNGTGNVPSGYMAALPRGYYSNGTLCKQGSYYYNSSAANSISVPVDIGPCPNGHYYYSYGATKAYTGNGYVAYYTYRSPNLWF